MPVFKEKQNLNNTFLPELTKILYKELDLKGSNEKTILLVQFELNKTGQIDNIEIISNKDSNSQQIEKIKSDIQESASF
jgi:hypothetical protein